MKDRSSKKVPTPPYTFGRPVKAPLAVRAVLGVTKAIEIAILGLIKLKAETKPARYRIRVVMIPAQLALIPYIG